MLPPHLPRYFAKGDPASSLPPDGAYSDGLLETMRCQRGRVPLWPLHRERLRRCGRIGDADLTRIGVVIQAAAANSPEDAARLRLRWGLIEDRPQWDLSLMPLEQAPELEPGARLFPCETRLTAAETANPGCKWLRRTGYNRAKAELPDGDCEGLLLDSGDRVIESLRCNLLAYVSGAWLTPALHRCGVRGVMREWLGRRIPLTEVELDIETLCAAEEVALCNSLRGLMPVWELIGHRAWPAGIPPETRRLQQLIAEELW